MPILSRLGVSLLEKKNQSATNDDNTFDAEEKIPCGRSREPEN